MSGRRRLARRLARDRGVFVPGLMGAGILLSIVMLISDGLKKLFPVRGERARAARLVSSARGRAYDLMAVGRGVPPLPHRVQRIPRPRVPAFVLGVVAAGITVALISITRSIFEAKTGILADRGWTLGAGYTAAGLFAAGSAIWLLSAAFGSARPRWLEYLAGWGPLGVLPGAPETDDPLTAPFTDPESPETDTHDDHDDSRSRAPAQTQLPRHAELTEGPRR